MKTTLDARPVHKVTVAVTGASKQSVLTVTGGNTEQALQAARMFYGKEYVKVIRVFSKHPEGKPLDFCNPERLMKYFKP